MKEQEDINYHRVAAAIDYIRLNFKAQPNLDDIARKVHLSPSHFQRLFTEWAGTSPKKFLQYISVEHAKKILREKQATIFEATLDSGLSSTSRLHDLFIHIEGMTPAEFKNGGKGLFIQFDFSETPFGNIIIASTSKGICHLAFHENKADALEALKSRFPKAGFKLMRDPVHANALAIFKHGQMEQYQLEDVKLHLKGTAFQLKVWEALLKIPMGHLCTYGDIARHIGHEKASRAVGTAIGSNSIAFLIPCHRVIQSSGIIGGYKWGATRKTALIGWENAQSES